MTYPNGAQTVFKSDTGEAFTVWTMDFSETMASVQTLKRFPMLGKFLKRFPNGNRMLRK